jgi:hypothetical protein
MAVFARWMFGGSSFWPSAVSTLDAAGRYGLSRKLARGMGS